METYLTQISNYLLTQSWQIAVLVVAIAAATFALRNKSAHVRYLLWLIVLAKCLTPPFLAIPLPVLPPDAPAETTVSQLGHIPPTDSEVDYASAVELPASSLGSIPTPTTTELPAVKEIPSTPVAQQGLTIQQWLAIVWVSGVSIFLLVAVIKASLTESELRRKRKPVADELLLRIKSEFATLGFRPFPKIWLVEGAGQPFVWGLFRGGVYLPDGFIKPDRAEYRRDILGHELSHVVRFDAAVNNMQVIVQTIFWFHPLVWWANRNIRAEREKCCDEMAIARLGAEVRDYSSAIVEILACEDKQNRPVPSLAVAGSLRNVEERIKTMMRPGKKFHKRPSFLAATVVLLLALLTAPTAFVLTSRAQAQDAPEYEEAPASEEAVEAVEPAEREVDETRAREEGRREEEEVEVRRSRRREEQSRELRRHHEELRRRAAQIERELESLRDDEDEKARDLKAELREIREEIRTIEREFGDREPGRERVVGREQRDANSRELIVKRRRLEERAHQVEDEIAELLRGGREDEAKQRRNALEEILMGIRQIDKQLGEAGDRDRTEPKEHRGNLIQERRKLEERANRIERELKELGDREEAQELRAELNAIERRVHEIDRELRGPQRDPERQEEARLEELRHAIDRLVDEGRHEEAARLERQAHEIMQRLERRRERRRPEAPGGDLERQVRQLRGELTELRNEMREIRALLERLLEREPRRVTERDY